MRCMPFPLSAPCWLDNRHGPHGDSRGIACHVHDVALVAFWRLLPRWAARDHDRACREA